MAWATPHSYFFMKWRANTTGNMDFVVLVSYGPICPFVMTVRKRRKTAAVSMSVSANET